MHRIHPKHRPVQTNPSAQQAPRETRTSAVPAELVRVIENVGTVSELNPRHHTATNLRQATVVRWQRTAGNEQIARVLSRRRAEAANPPTTASTGPIRRAVIQRAITFDVAKQRIKRAGSGWGTDEGAIYAAIRECNDRPRLQADPDVQRMLRSEMKGHELWKAYLLLHYGAEAAFPPAINEIWAATKGAGTDEGRIMRALQKLSAADAQLIATVPGLRDILKGDLSGKDLAATNDLLAGSYAQAIARHKVNVAHMKSELTRYKSAASPPKLRNTGEWLEPSTPGVAPKNDLFVLTHTHDFAARAAEHGHKNEEAYFGDRTQYPSDAADYDARIGEERNIHYAPPGVQGEHLGRKIWVHDPFGMTVKRLEEVLIHEVQHDADRHDKEQGYDESFKSPLESWNRYKTEFRSYWVDGERDTALLTTVHNPALAPFDNAKQRAIFLHMYGNSPTEVYAVWLRPNYDKNTTAYGQKFQDLVHGYKAPEGVNLVNSPRIDNFYLQLGRCRPGDTNLAASPLKELDAAAKALDANDQATMNAAEAGRLQEMLKDRLAPAVLTHIATIVNGGTAPGWLAVDIAQERKAIAAAGKGWGTDEGAIFKTIANAGPAKRAQMKTDPTVRRIIYSEMKGHDRWKALFMLEFGPQNQWPADVRAFWNATEGAGTDEGAIRTTLKALPRARIEALAKIEGLREMLRDDLSGKDEQEAEDALSGYGFALADHQQDMAAVTGMIRAGLTSADPVWKAICVKLNDRTKASIHAMSRTHDSWQRAVAAGQIGNEAYFGADAPYPAATGRYERQQSKNQGVRFVAPGVPSETSGSSFYLYNARSIPAASLRAELQTFGSALP